MISAVAVGRNNASHPRLKQSLESANRKQARPHFPWRTHFPLHADSGRTIYLVAFNQSHNCASIFIGRRNARRNGEYLNDLLRRQQQEFPGVVMIPPEGGFDSASPQFPHGAPEHLPEITCTAEFRSSSPARNESELASALTLIWFQSAFGAVEALDATFAKINWDVHARDYSP